MIDIIDYLDATPLSRKKNALKGSKISMVRWIMKEGKYEYDKGYSTKVFDLLYDLNKDRLAGLVNRGFNTSGKQLPLIKIVLEPNTFY